MIWTWISQTHVFNKWYIDTNAKCNFIKHYGGVSIKDTFSIIFTLFKQVFMILRYIKDNSSISLDISRSSKLQGI